MSRLASSRSDTAAKRTAPADDGEVGTVSAWAWAGIGVVAWTAVGVPLAFLVGRVLRRLDERAYRDLAPHRDVPADGPPGSAPAPTDESAR